MYKWLLVALLIPTMATAATKRPKEPADPCTPIGRTEDGKLVYAMACENLPTPPKPAASAAPPAAAAPAEDDPGGIFGFHAPSFIRPTNDQERQTGVGPAVPR